MQEVFSGCKEKQMISADVQTKPLLYGRMQGAQRLGISLRTFDELLATKQLRSVKIGKRRLVSEEAILDFIKRAEKR
jgi:excisionase family DNA binding protein